MKPYYSDSGITIYHGDCREVPEWRCADVMVTDPPYGRGWKQGALKLSGSGAHTGIAGDASTAVRDEALSVFEGRLVIAFGDLMLPPPSGTKQVLVYLKPTNAGMRGATAGFRRDVEAVYLIGPWPSGINGCSSILRTGARSQGNPSSIQGQTGHPHAKPVDLMATLVALAVEHSGQSRCTVADPFMGAGSTLMAAKQAGVEAIGIETDEAYCETAARRLAQGVLISC